MDSNDPLDALEVWLQARLEDVHVSLPGTVTTYSKETRRATVKPSVRLRSLHGDKLDIPPIQGVPVIWPGSQDFTVQSALKRGDRVLLVFSESSIGNWIRGTGDVDAEDETRFSLQDAIAIPGLWPTGSVPKHPMSTAAWGMASENLEIGGTKAGKAVVKNGTASLGDVIEGIRNQLDTLNTLTKAIAGSAGVPTAPFDAITLALQDTKAKIGGLLE